MGENRVYTLYGKLYFQNHVNNYAEFKPGGMSHVSIFGAFFSFIGKQGCKRICLANICNGL